MLKRLKDAYWSEQSPTIATGVLAVGTSLLFCVGLILIFHAQASNQTKQLKAAVTGIKEGSAELDSLVVNGDTTVKGELTTEQGVSIAGDVEVEGEVTIQSALTADSFETIGDAKIGGNLDAQSATVLQTTLQVLGAATMQDTLDVGGKVTLQDALNVVGEVSIGGSLQVSGAASIDDLDVAGRATLRKSLDVGGEASIGGSIQVVGAATLAELTVDGNTGLRSALQVGGNTVLEGDLTVSNGVPGSPQPATVLQDTLTVEGSTLLRGNLDVAGAAIFRDDVEVAGVTTLQGDLIVGTGVVGAAQPSVELSGSLNVAGAAEFNSTLEAYGATILHNTLTVDGATTLETLTVTQPATFTSLSVEDIATFASTITVAGAATFEDLNVCLYLSGETLVPTPGCTATISGSLTAADATFGNGLTVNGVASVTGELEVTGNTRMNSGLTVDQEMTVAGNVYILGGDGVYNAQGGIEGNLTVDGYVDAGSGFLVGTGTPGVGRSCGANEYLRGIQVVGGIVTEGTCSSAGDTQTSAGCGGEAGFHLRITAITNGIVTAVQCARDDGDVYGNDGTPDGDAGAYYDLAEKFPSTQSLEPGDVVAIDPDNVEYVVKGTSASAKLMIGVISTAPGITLGENGPGYPVALAGRVPVKVTAEGGTIVPGDYLTAASTPGYAKKAGPGEKTLGQAMAAFSGSTGTVMMFVNTSGGNLSSQDFVQGTNAPTQGGSAQFADLNVSGHTTLATLNVTGLATVKDLTVTGATAVADLTINGHIVGNDDTRGVVTIKQGEQTARKVFGRAYSKQPVVVASPTNEALPYKVTASKEGFDIGLTAPATTDITFNFLVQE